MQSLVIVPKPNSMVCLCLDTMQCNDTPLRPVHRAPTVNDIFPKLMNMTLIDASSGYHNLKPDRNHNT